MRGAAPKLTDERLKSWLDSDQLGRERLCQAVLSVDARMSDVRPRQPRGGPDGGRDLEAHDADGHVVWAAIGFQNLVSDSTKDRRQAHRKFESDLGRALGELPSLHGFIFITNVALTTGAKDKLVALAKERGIKFCDVVDRERLRIVLDTPEGFSARYQYLGIPLSDAEQATFFARWGQEIQSLVESSFGSMERRLRRIEFHHEKNRPLRLLSFTLKLRQPVTRTEIPCFRALLLLSSLSSGHVYRTLHLGVCSDEGYWSSDRPNILPCTVGVFWADDADKNVARSQTPREEPMAFVHAHSGYDEWWPIPAPTLGDLDENMFVFFFSRKLAELVDDVSISANEYVLWRASRDNLGFDDPQKMPDWPFEFAPEQMEDPWVRVMLKGGLVGQLSFSDETPRRTFEPNEGPTRIARERDGSS